MINPDLLTASRLLKEWQPRIPHGMETVMADVRKTLETIRPIKDSLLAWVPLREAMDNAVNAIKNNPEFNFLRLVDKDTLTDEELSARLEVMETNLEKYLTNLNVYSLWLGALFAVNTSPEDNPERVRHFFVSVRTLIEHLIDHLLAPIDKVQAWDQYPERLRELKEKNPNLPPDAMPRSIRIKYFCSKVQFALVEEWTEKEIRFINGLYKEVCKIHAPEIPLSQSQLDVIRLHAGTTIWLLSVLHEVIEGE